MKTSCQPKPEKVETSVVEISAQPAPKSAQRKSTHGFGLMVKNCLIRSLRYLKLKRAQRMRRLTKEEWNGQWKESQTIEDRRLEIYKKDPWL